MKEWYKGLALLLCLAAMLSGCAREIENSQMSVAESRTEENSAAMQTVPISGKELRMTAYMPKSLNPLKVTEQENAQLLMLIFMPLLETDEEGAPTAQGVAEQWRVSLDGYQVTLYIKDNIYWHDGELLTPSDVVYSLNALADSQTDHYWKEQLRSLTSVELGEGREVILHFSSPVDEHRMSILAVPVLPEHIYDGWENRDWSPVGSGPYKVTEYQAMREIQLEANENYIGGCPKLSTLVVEITRSADATQTAFEHGLTQILYEEVPTGMSTENIYHHAVYQTDTHILQLMYMNQREGMLFSDPAMRQAVMYCVDAQELIDRTQVHQGTASESVVPKWLAEDGLEQSYGVDYQKAYSLLGEHKMAEVRLIVSKEEETVIAQAKLIYEQLMEIGLKVRVILYEEADWKQALEDGEYDLAFGSCPIRSLQDLYTLLHSDGTGNYSGRKDETLDALLDGIGEAEAGEREAAYQALARYVWETCPVCPLYYSRQAVVVSKLLGGSLTPTPYHIYKGIENLYYIQ